MNNKKDLRKDIAFSQVFLLVVSIVAFTWAIGSEVNVVSGQVSDAELNYREKHCFLGFCKFPGETNSVYDTQHKAVYKKDNNGNWAFYQKINDKTPTNPKVTDSNTIKNLDEVLKLNSPKDVPGNILLSIYGINPEKPSGAPPALQTPGDGLREEPKQPIEPPSAAPPKEDSTKDPSTQIGTPEWCNAIDATTGKKNSEGGRGVACYSFLGIIGESALYAVGVAAAIQALGPIFGLDSEQTEVLSRTTAIGVLAGKLSADFGAKSVATSGAGQGTFSNTWFAGNGATYVGLGAAGAYFVANYRDEESKRVSFSCIPWQAPLGGNNCETCNKGFLPCSEYQCKSLGQNCELVNPGTQEEQCVWVNRNDVTAPIITAMEEGLLSADYAYSPNDAILPPDRGVSVLYSLSDDNCIPAFTPLRIGIASNEPAKCKVDLLRKDDFETMGFEMSSGLLQYNHTFSLSLPGSDNLNSSGIEVQNDGNYDLFVRCEDANGNSNEGTFVFKYCVDKGPDVTPPLIVATSIPNNAPVSFNQTSLNLEVYTNEPSECKWSHNNREYDSMETQMDCDNFISNNNAQGLYTCRTILDSIKDRFVNKFYFRCQDKPQSPENERNVNQESFEYSVVGTQALVIDYALPNDTIRDSTSAVRVPFEVKTSAGFDEGRALCYYSDTGDDEDFVQFFESDSHLHKQDLFLPSGSYVYYIRCVDLGGNRDDRTISFDVESDNVNPNVVRAYHEEQYLKLITDEEANCVYDVVDCSYPFESGIPITNIDDTNHFTDWNLKKNLYVKCQDLYGNQPLPNQCSIVVKSSDF